MEDPPSCTLEKRLVSAGAAECAGEPECSRTSSVCTSPICSGADGRFSRRGGEGGSLQAFWDGRAACREAFLSVLEGKACGGRFLPADPARRRHAGAGAPVVRLRRKACRMYGWRRHPVWPTPERRRLGDASNPRCSTCLGCGNRGPDGFSDPRLSVAPVGAGDVGHVLPRQGHPAGERLLFGGAHIVQNDLQTLIRQAAGTDDHAFHGDGPP